jgi:hypothetical protein
MLRLHYCVSYQHTEGSNTNTCDESSRKNVGVVANKRLDNNTNGEDDAGNDDGPSTPSCISNISVDEGSYPSSKLEDGSEQATGDTIATGFGVPRFQLRR